MSKLPGKTIYSGRRRPTTRKSGFSSHPGATGGEWKDEPSETIVIPRGFTLEFKFEIPAHTAGTWIGFGGWYCCEDVVEMNWKLPFDKFTFTPPSKPNWSKFGSAWQGDGQACIATVSVTAKKDVDFHFWKMECGLIHNPGCYTGEKFVECETPSYLAKIYDLSPESHFWDAQGDVTCEFTSHNHDVDIYGDGFAITVKSCNRCARFLPINFGNIGAKVGEAERLTLSFSNHCIARRPCTHTGFGKLRNPDTGAILKLEYGFQLECRYCKKYCVNAAHNKERTAAQMKEDGARRRFFELLIAELYQESKQLAFKHRTGKELADFIWQKFGKKCFNCGEALASSRDMHLDHTRPLALLWALDETATALCGTCNSSKSDRFPSDFYTEAGKLQKLSELTGIPLTDLENPSPNLEVVKELVSRVDWLFEHFLLRPEMVKERDGKVTAELVVKALQKTLNLCPPRLRLDLEKEYLRRQAK